MCETLAVCDTPCCRVWDGAVVLSQYLSSAASPLHEHRRTRAAAASTSTDNGPAAEADQPLSQDPSEAAADAGQQQPEQQHHQHRQHAQSEQADQQQQPGLQQAALQQQDWQLQGACPSLTPPSDPAQPAGAQLPGLTCLELGAGTGAVSLCLLAAGVVDCTLLTDIPDMLPHLQSNVEHNSSVLDPSRALVLPLRWAEAADVAGLQQAGRQQLAQRQRRGFGRQQAAQLPPVQLRPPFELIVGSDLIYYSYTAATPHSRLLLQALVQLAGPGSLIFLALSLHHNPEEVHAFLDWAEEVWGFGVERVTAGIPSEYVVPDVLVVRLHLRDTQRAQTAAAAAAAGTLRRKDEH